MDCTIQPAKSEKSSNLTFAISTLEKTFPITKWLFYFSGILLALYTGFVVLDVVLRYFFSRPMSSSVDIGGMVMTVFLFLAAPYVQIEKEHIVIDIITGRLSPKTNLLLSTFMYVFSLIIIGAIVWQSSLVSLAFYHLGSKSQSGLSLLPSVIMIPVGSVFLFIVFLRDILCRIQEFKEFNVGIISGLFIIAAPIVITVTAVFWMLGDSADINTYVLAGICVLILFALMFLGMPLGFAFLLMSVVLTGFSLSFNAGLMLIGKTLFTQTANYSWSVIPLFTFMSFIFMASGIGTDCFLAAYKWIGHLKGGLALATVLACTAFAAVNGGPLPAVIVMGTIGLPEMRKYAYSDKLSSGSILAGSTLGPMIPPSVSLIIYGIIARESIGQLFIAGIIPGALLAISFILVILIWSHLNPELAPAGKKSNWSERIKTLPTFMPILLLFILVIGGIYAGIFSAMEGGGIGAFGSLVIAIVSRRFNMAKFITSLKDSAKTNCMLLFVIIAGLLFGNSLGASGLSLKMVEFTQGLGLSPMQFIWIILIIYLLFGIICDAPIILLLTLPILAPIMKALGVNMVWFGIVSTLIVNLGGITPPFAMGIFMLKYVGPKDLSLAAMYRGVMPFCIASAILVIIILFFPEIAIWLPRTMS